MNSIMSKDGSAFAFGLTGGILALEAAATLGITKALARRATLHRLPSDGGRLIMIPTLAIDVAASPPWLENAAQGLVHSDECGRAPDSRGRPGPARPGVGEFFAG